MLSVNNKIAVCIINYKSFEYTKFCIDNLRINTNLDFNLYVYDIDEQSSLEMIEYIQELNNLSCKDYLDKYPHKYFKVDTIPLNEIKSMFMIESKEEYLCIIPNNLYVGQNWLEDLIYNYTQCQNTGIISIKNQTTKCKLSVLPFDSDNDEIELKNVWLGDNNFVEGIMFFDRKMANGLYPLMFGKEEKINGYTDDEMSFVSNLMGKNNFYILKQSVKKVYISNQLLFTHKTPQNDVLFRKYANELAKSNK
jgi:hypothetical protein